MVPKGVENGSKTWLSLPSWAFDYAYRIDNNWAVGVQSELVLTEFEVETYDDKKVLSRTKPFSTIAMVGYYPWKNVMVFLGAGGEYAFEETFAMFRLGAEPSIEINERFEMLLSCTYDFKIDAYDNFGISLGIGYKF